MKYLFILTLLFLSSCSEPEEAKNSLDGKWKTICFATSKNSTIYSHKNIFFKHGQVTIDIFFYSDSSCLNPTGHINGINSFYIGPDIEIDSTPLNSFIMNDLAVWKLSVNDQKILEFNEKHLHCTEVKDADGSILGHTCPNLNVSEMIGNAVHITDDTLMFHYFQDIDRPTTPFTFSPSSKYMRD